MAREKRKYHVHVVDRMTGEFVVMTGPLPRELARAYASGFDRGGKPQGLKAQVKPVGDASPTLTLFDVVDPAGNALLEGADVHRAQGYCRQWNVRLPKAQRATIVPVTWQRAQPRPARRGS